MFPVRNEAIDYIMKRLVLMMALLMIYPRVLFAHEEYIYLVRKGETLSEIARDRIDKPVYKKNGGLAKVIELNRGIADFNKIYPGQRIILPGPNPTRDVASSKTPEPVPAPVVEAPAAVKCPPAPVAEASAQPEPAREPAAEVPATPAKVDEEPDPVSHLEADLGMEYFKVSAKDPVNGGSATLLSNTSPNLSLGWTLDWNEDWSSRLRFTAQSVHIENATSSSSTIVNGHESSYGFEAAAIRHWNKNSHTAFTVGSSAQIFARAITTTNVTVDRVQEMYVGAEHEQDLVRVKSATAGLGLSAAALGGGTGVGYTTKGGWESDVSAYIKHELKKSKVELKGKVFYGVRKQDSSIVQEDETHLGAFFGVSWKLGD